MTITTLSRRNAWTSCFFPLTLTSWVVANIGDLLLLELSNASYICFNRLSPRHLYFDYNRSGLKRRGNNATETARLLKQELDFELCLDLQFHDLLSSKRLDEPSPN